MSEIKPYPLVWPLGYPRTPEQRSSQFKVTMAAAFEGLQEELRLWGVTDVVISCNAPEGPRGARYLIREKNQDSGVVAYFTRAQEQWAIPCDEYETILENAQALKHMIGAMRTIDRHGGANALKAAGSQFKALPAPGETSGLGWWDFLEVSEKASEEMIHQAYKVKAKTCHPDKGGSAHQWETLQSAYAQALEARVQINQ